MGEQTISGGGAIGVSPPDRGSLPPWRGPMHLAPAALLLLLLFGCAPVEGPEGRRAPMAVPSATDISNAMAHSMPPDAELPGMMCAIVEDIRCSPIGRSGRLQCSFLEPHRHVRRTAVFERAGRTEWERNGNWRWVRGWRRCGRYF